MRRNIILHLLSWRLKDIENSLCVIHQQGFNAIQISPIQTTKDDGGEWWKLYQPTSFEIGNSQIGSKEDLISLCRSAKRYDICIIADVVLRHTAGMDTGELIPHQNVHSYLRDNPEFWGIQKNISDYSNRQECIDLCMGLPSLNYRNRDLQDIYLGFLEELVSCGVSGFRIDMGKHFALPSEGSDFWINVFKTIQDKHPYLFNYAEVIDSSRHYLEQYVKYINVFTDGWVYDSSKMVRYVETHDTFLTFGYTKEYTDKMIMDEWNTLTRSNSHICFYSRSWSRLWECDRIREMNQFPLIM